MDSIIGDVGTARRIVEMSLMSLKRVLFVSLMLAITIPSCVEQPLISEKPNVIIIFTDDLGYSDLSSYGSVAYQTPNIDRLAAEGARFTDFYVSQPICTASRASLMTGAYANRIGLNGALGPSTGIGIHPDETTLGELFQRNDYRTALFGKWHLGKFPEFFPTRHGFDEFYGIPYSNDMWPFHPENPEAWPDLPLYDGQEITGYNTDQSRFTTDLTQRSIKFIESAVNDEAPFFLYLPHPMPHVPLFVSEERANNSGAGLYGDVVNEIDWSVGEIMQTLEDLGIEENTFLIFTSDNGPWLSYGNHAGSAHPLREGKGTVFEGGVRVPFIVRWPQFIPPQTVIKAPAMTIDILPTFAELLGDDRGSLPIDGVSIWKLLTNQIDSPVQEAYYFYYNDNELQAIRSGEWKLHFPHTYRTMIGQTSGADGTPGSYNYEVNTGLELYNLTDDMAEQHNVAIEYPGVVDRLAKLADLKRKQLGDTLTNQPGSELREPGRVDI